MSKQVQYSLDEAGFVREIKLLAACYDRRLSNKSNTPPAAQQPANPPATGGGVQSLGGLTEEEYTEMFHRGEIM